MITTWFFAIVIVYLTDVISNSTTMTIIGTIPHNYFISHIFYFMSCSVTCNCTFISLNYHNVKKIIHKVTLNITIATWFLIIILNRKIVLSYLIIMTLYPTMWLYFAIVPWFFLLSFYVSQIHVSQLWFYLILSLWLDIS